MIISNVINECIIVHKKLADTIILAKNRDRAYAPTLELVHEMIGGVEVLYLHDVVTDWSEGMNQYGIGLVNTALMVGFDEHEKKLVKKQGKKSKDGVKIREVLSKRTIQDAVRTASTYMGGINGHTFITDGVTMVSMEKTSRVKPKFKLHSDTKLTVRTNHGEIYPDAGYTHGPNYLSSKIRKLSTQNVLQDIESDNLLDYMKKQFYDMGSNLNMRRSTDKMTTSSQLQLNVDKKLVTLHYFVDKVEGSVSYVNRLPQGYTPILSYEIKPVHD